ncbi:MAG: aminoglycoside phosphotransferase family protein [Actinomycetota bacterium]
MIPTLVERLCSQSVTPALPSPPTNGLVLGVDRSADAKVTVLLFGKGKDPVAVAKIARSELSGRSVLAEYEFLRHVYSGLPPHLASTVPRAIDLLDMGGVPAFVMGFLPGSPMTVDYYSPGHASSTSAAQKDFAVAEQWLARWQVATSGPDVPFGELLESWLTPTVERYLDQVGRNQVEEEFLIDALTLARPFADVQMPVGTEHGDFWMGNLLVDGLRLSGVVDWEFGRTSGIPILDAFKFPTSYGFYLDRSRPWGGGAVPGHPGREDSAGRWRQYGSWPNLVGFGHVWFGNGHLPQLARTWLENAAARTRTPRALLPALFSGFLAEQALRANTPEFRDGYRTLIDAVANEHQGWWLWDAA